MVLQVDESHCTAAPLFSKHAPGSDRLDDSLKGGLADKWIDQQTYTSRWQQWRIPLDSIEAASGDEESEFDNRRQYAAGDATVLECILFWQTKNRCSYRAV